VNLEKVKVGMS